MAGYLFTLAVLIADLFFVPFAMRHLEQQIDQTGLIVISLLLGAVNLAVVASWCHMIAARRKGSLRLEFPDRAYNQGEEISGQLVLTLKRSVEARYLRVRMIATAHRRNDKGPVTTVVWKQELDLIGERPLSPGTQRFSFKFTVPESARTADADLTERVLTQLARGTLSWKISAELDLDGANLTGEKGVRVNDGDVW